MKQLSVLLLCCLMASGASAETFVAKVIAVMDGDTVMVLQGNKKTSVRLAGIDAPEKLQPHGTASRNALAAMVLHKDVLVTTKAVDEYGRIVALVQAGRIHVNEEQLRRGMAWEYSHYHNDKALVALQGEAQKARRGLWADAKPVPPWEFRKGHTTAREVEASNTACGKKHYCSQMVSCEEAKFYLTQCRIKTLDKDGDGVPCENLCGARPR